MNFKIGDLFRLKNNISIYLLLIEEIFNGFFKCIVFTEDIELGTLKETTPFLILEEQKTILAELPLWIYGSRSLLSKYSDFVTETTLNCIPIEELISYAETTPIPETPQGKYIRNVAATLAPINTCSLFEYLEELENLEESIIPEV